MTDTHSEIADRFERLMKMKSNEERLLMGFSMFNAARQIVKSAILKQNPRISAKKMRQEIFKRFYRPV